MASPIKRLTKGNFPSLIDTATANKLIDAINSLLGMTIAPNGAGKMVTGEASCVLDLSGLISLIGKVQTSQDAALQTTAPGNPDAGGGGSVTALNAKVNAVINSINHATITAVCNLDSTITVTLTFPGMPTVS